MIGTATGRAWKPRARIHDAAYEVGFCRAPVDTLPREARDLTAEHLYRWGLERVVDDAQVVVSELVTNAVRYAPYGLVAFTLGYADGLLRIEVEDSSPEDPVLRCPADEEHGRGLQLVRLLSGRWGVRRNSNGTKTTWCLLDTAHARW